VKRLKKMEKGADSGRGITVEGFKAELYESLELLLADRDFRVLCRLQDGVYRDVLVALLKRVLRPSSFKDANDFVSDLTQIGALEVELRYVETAVPRQLFVRRRKTKMGEVEKLQIPKGFEWVGEVETPRGEPMLLLRTYKQVLKPSKELVAVCNNLAVSRN
jgi:hypothetical protein